jgi:hypothetical protein
MGKQCVTNAAAALFYSLIVSPAHWQSQDLDDILDQGDFWYKEMKSAIPCLSYLSVDQLPPYYSCFNQYFKLKCVGVPHNVTLNYTENSPALPMADFIRKFNTQYGVIVLLGSQAFALIHVDDRYYLFDSHSRDKFGNSASDGFSIFLSFSNSSHLNIYLKAGVQVNLGQ